MSDHTIVRTARSSGGYTYTTQISTPDGGVRSRPATELDWLTAELERLANVRAGDIAEGPDDFADALEVAEALRRMIDDLTGQPGAASGTGESPALA